MEVSYLEPLPGVHQLRTQDDISLFLVLLVELQIEIQYNTIRHGSRNSPYTYNSPGHRNNTT